MAGIYVRDPKKPVTYRAIKEIGYLYELPDGAIVKIECLPGQLSRTQFGTLSLDARTRLTVVAKSLEQCPRPARFDYPKQFRLGEYVLLAGGKEEVRVQPSLRQVERVVGANGEVTYIPTADWLPKVDLRKVTEAMTLPSTLARLGGSPQAFSNVVARQREILEWLFQGRDWFLRKENESHPAVADWKRCGEMMTWGGRKPDSLSPEELRYAARISLNVLFMVRLSGGSISELTLGPLDSFGDFAVQKKIRSRVLEPSSYEDLLVELYAASWHRSKDREVSLLETTGYPDIRVRIRSLNFPIYIECKRLTVSNENRIQSNIKDASNKISRGSQGSYAGAYGVALLDFSAVVGLRRQEAQTIPPLIEDVERKVRGAIRGNKNTHVNSAIVVWDDYGVVGDEPEQMMMFRRRAQVFHHELTRRKLGLKELFDGYAVRMPLRQVPDELL